MAGRKKSVIDLEPLRRLCEIHCTAEECAGFFGCSTDTIDRRLKEAKEGNFAEFYKKHSGAGKASLRRAQWKAALHGNPTMLIWLGKQHLEQSDKQDVQHGGDIKLTCSFDFEGGNG